MALLATRLADADKGDLTGSAVAFGKAGDELSGPSREAVGRSRSVRTGSRLSGSLP
jgi:hypothetical protein